jgi:hypothetical protein
MASFVPPITNSPSPVSITGVIDTDTIIEYTVAGVLILSIIFVEDIDLFVQRNVLLLIALVFSLIFGAGVLYSENPPLAMFAMLLLASIAAVQSTIVKPKSIHHTF